MLHAPTLWPHPILPWIPENQVWWQNRQQQKKTKYADLLTTHHFVPTDIETTGVFGPEAFSFFKELGRCLRACSGDLLSFSHLLQQIGVTIQQGTSSWPGVEI